MQICISRRKGSWHHSGRVGPGMHCCPRITMKFSYRVTGITLFVVTLTVLYLTWGDDLMTWDDKHDSVRKRGGSKMADLARRLLHPSGLTKSQVCVSADCSEPSYEEATADIHTSDLLAKVMQKPVVKSMHHLSQFDMRPIRSKSKQDPDDENRYFQPPASGPAPLKVIVVPHSHNDPGWLKTVESYFSDQTKPTLDNMVDKLLKFPQMTFIWVESVFLHMWWNTLEQQRKDSVRLLLRRGQLEIVVGSWVVPDEANPHYFALIDQMIEGHQWLEKTMGVKPRNTWSLDPFGYSSTLPYLYHRAGFDHMVILRIHKDIKELMMESRNMEFFWRQTWDACNDTDIPTLLMPYQLYNIKHSCGPDHDTCLNFDFRKIPGEFSEAHTQPITTENVERLSKLLLRQYQKKAALYKHNVVLIPLGDDFRYDREIEWDQQFQNYQMIFDHINGQKKWNVEAKFGTVQTYFDEVKKNMEILLQNSDQTSSDLIVPTLEGDFFPYTDDDRKEYWTGYFSTRSYDKNLGRELEVHLRAADILHTLALATHKDKFEAHQTNWQSLTEARQSLGLFQHHDAITGTAKFFVVRDYEERLRNGLEGTIDVIKSSLRALLSGDPAKNAKIDIYDISVASGLRLLAPQRHRLLFDKNIATLVVFNPTAHSREEVVRVTIETSRVLVKNDKGELVKAQVNNVFTETGNVDRSEYELLFLSSLPALSLIRYSVELVEDRSAPTVPMATVTIVNHRVVNSDENEMDLDRDETNAHKTDKTADEEEILLENDVYRVQFSKETGFIDTVTTKELLQTFHTEMDFLMYTSQSDGAYIFKPTGSASASDFVNYPRMRILRGPLVSEIFVQQPLLNHTVRLYNTTCHSLNAAIEINNIVNMETMDNKDMIMRISTNIKNADNGTVFYTDLNGFQTMKRIRFPNAPTEANFYPSSSHVYLQDNSARLSLLSAQPLGASCQAPGTIEVMLDRRCLYDDGRGLGEGVLDNKLTPSRFYLTIEQLQSKSLPLDEASMQRSSQPSIRVHMLVNRLRHYPLVAHVRHLPVAPSESFLLARRSLPCDVLLVNLRSLVSDPRNPQAALILHRVGHSCDLTYPQCDFKKEELSLAGLFSDTPITVANETTLSLMHHKHITNVGKPLELSAMQLYTFKVGFTRQDSQ